MLIIAYILYMQKILTIILILWIGLLQAGEIYGKVLHVVDGDTVWIAADSRQIKVRLWGIDAPESRQPGGKEATIYLTNRIKGKSVRVITHGQDKYRRTIGVIWLDNTDINLDMIAAGHAWHYDRYAPHARNYAKAQAQAATLRNGLWAQKNPVSPWEYRTDQDDD